MVLSSKQFFKYCPVCGEKLKTMKAKHAHPICTQCGFEFFQNSKPTTAAFIKNKKGEIMLVKRGIKPFYGYWDTPGGFLEEGEDPVAGLKRELYEELGVRLKKIQLFGLYPDTYNHQFKLHILNVIYTAEIASGIPHSQDDVSEYKWFTKKTIPWSRLSFKWIRPALNDLFKL